MLVEYIEDTYNENNLCKLIEFPLHLYIYGCPKSGKKTVLQHCMNKLCISYTTLLFSDCAEIQNEINRSFFEQERVYIHITGFENIENIQTLRTFQKIMKSHLPFVKFILTTTKYNFEILKYFTFYRFKNNENYEKSLLAFCNKFKVMYTNHVDTMNIEILKCIKNSKLNDIRTLTMNLTKNNFPFTEFYKFVISNTSNYDIIQKAAECDHLSCLGNKKVFYFEHFLFFIKNGNLHKFIKV